MKPLPHLERSGKITLQNFPYPITKAIAKGLSVPNPLYFKMKNISPRAMYGMKETFDYYHFDSFSNTLLTPRGAYPRIAKYLANNSIEYSMAALKPNYDLPKDWKMNIELRDYQKPTYNALLSKLTSEGIAALGTGYGKTVISLKLASDKRLRTLIIAPYSSVFDQFKADVEKFFGKSVGVIRGKVCDLQPITIAMIQSLSNLRKTKPALFTDISNEFDFLVVDEAQEFVSDARWQTLASLHIPFYLALTGTPERSQDDGRTEALFHIHGPILVQDKLPTTTPTAIIEKLPFKITPSFDYHEMVDDLVKHPERNKRVAEAAISFVSEEKRKVLILTKRKEHAKLIHKLIPETYRAYLLDSSVSQKKRKDTLLSLRNGEAEFDILIGTSALLATGTDIPSLDTLILAGEFKSNVLLAQAGGRILRLLSGKKPPVILDFLDNNQIFRRQSLIRKNTYKKLGWIIYER